MTCSSVAAASVLAKTTRDALMVEMAGHYPAYSWDVNKGYASPEHMAALRSLGPCEMHRRSWAIPGGDHESELDLAT
jgi:ribonuclease HII